MNDLRESHGGKLIAAVVVSLLFVFFRVLGAYWLQNSTNPDYSVVVLMAKHMAQGVDFPLFFYGQAYMGSLEPMVSALLCRLVGFSGFTVCMGTVIFSVAMIPFIYLLGRNAGGWVAGMSALLFCAIGPSGFFHYTASPRGGYASAMFFTVFLLWAILELAWREVQGRRCSWAAYLGVGFAGGIAFWCDPLVSPAILAGAVMYVVVVGRQAFLKKRLYLTVPGFISGLSPFFIWNLQDNWASLNMAAQATKAVDFTKGVRLFFARFADLLDYSGLPWFWIVLISCVYVGMFLCGVSGAVGSLRSIRSSRRSITLSGVILFVIVFIVCFSDSDSASVTTPRYLLPVVTAVGVLAGYAVSVQRNSRRFAALAILLLICAFQAWHLRVFLDLKRRDDDFLRGSSELARYLAVNEVKSMYGDLHTWCLNYVLNEKYLISGVDLERYSPYVKRMEEAGSVGILCPRRELSQFLSSLRVSCQRGNPGGFDLWHGFSRETTPHSEVPKRLIGSVTDSKQRELSDKLFDRSLLTGWSTGGGIDGGLELTVSFTESVRVEGVRVLCRPGHYPQSWLLLGRNGSNQKWHELIAETSVMPYFWSGPRFFARGSFFRVEGAVLPELCTEVKLVFPRVREGSGMRISELQIYSESSAAESSQNGDILELAKFLDEKGIQTVFADRWESNELQGRCDARAILDLGVYADRRVEDGVDLALGKSTAMIVRSCDESWTQGVLDSHGIQMSKQLLRPWTIFYFDDAQWQEKYAEATGLLWVGFGCVSESIKHHALAIARAAESEYAGGGAAPHAIGTMHHALDTYQNYRDGAGKMAVWLSNEGRASEAMIWQDRYDSMWLPSVEASTDFAGRAALLGITVDDVEFAPGSQIKIRYYWKCKPENRVRDLVVFTHFKRGKVILFQDDRPFLADQDVLYQPFQEVFVEERTVTIPYSVSPGDCEVWIGLYDLAYENKRVSVKTALNTHNKEIHLPIVLRIGTD